MKVSGGLWDEAKDLYESLGAYVRAGVEMDAQWQSGAKVGFRGIKLERDVVKQFQGAQVWLACFDELTQFTEKQFWFVWSRLRSQKAWWSARKLGSGRRKWFEGFERDVTDRPIPPAAALVYAGKGGTVRLFRPYLRAGCNPDPDSWVRKLIDWWIGEDGLPIPERDGVVRWTALLGDERHWFDTEAECQQWLSLIGDEDQEPVSVTFIRSKLSDNRLGDPNYRRQLASLDAVSRAQLLDGNWNVRAKGGAYFSRTWFDVWDAMVPDAQVVARARGWDFGGSEVTEERPDPDWSASVRQELLKNGTLVFADASRCRLSEGGIDEYVKATVIADGPRVTQCIWQDPGAGGKFMALRMKRIMELALPSVKVVIVVATKDKVTYAKPLSARLDPRTMHGQPRVAALRAAWNLPLFGEFEAFPSENNEVHDDWVDAASRAYMELDPLNVNFARDFLSSMRRVQV
jgi:predicted phage terminase large subunit-like protein